MQLCMHSEPQVAGAKIGGGETSGTSTPGQAGDLCNLRTCFGAEVATDLGPVGQSLSLSYSNFALVGDPPTSDVLQASRLCHSPGELYTRPCAHL